MLLTLTRGVISSGSNDTPSSVTPGDTGDSLVYLPAVFKFQGAPQIAGCSLFPVDNVWNTPVDTLPIDDNSGAYIAAIGADDYLHADFGSGTWDGGPIGIPRAGQPAAGRRHL